MKLFFIDYIKFKTPKKRMPLLLSKMKKNKKQESKKKNVDDSNNPKLRQFKSRNSSQLKEDFG